MRVLCIIILLLSLCISCNEKESTIRITSFPINESLKSDLIQVPPIIWAPTNMFITGNKLIVFQIKKDPVFDIFQLPECQYLFSGGAKGNGPPDFPPDIYTKSFIMSPNGFQVFFQGDKSLRNVVVEQDKLFRDNSNIDVDRLDINSYPVNGFLPINDSLFCYWSEFGSSTEYTMLNTYTNKHFSFSNYPDWNNANIDKEKLPFLYIKNSIAKPDGERFMSFYAFIKHIRLFSNKGELLKEISVDIEPFNTLIEDDFDKRQISYFAYPQATDKYIYAFCKNTNEKTRKNTELQVWDWNGNPIAKYQLDKELTYFTISEDFKKIYAVNYENEDVIYTYELPFF